MIRKTGDRNLVHLVNSVPNPHSQLREEKMSSGIFRFFGASVATMLFVGFALAPTPEPAQGLQCASNPLIGTWRLNLQKRSGERRVGKECRYRLWVEGSVQTRYMKKRVR